MTGAAVAEIEFDATAPRGHYLGEDMALVINDAVRRRRKHVGHDIAGFEKRQKLWQRRYGLTHVDHHGDVEGRRRLLRAAQDFVIVLPSHVAGEPGFDSDDHVAV